MRSANGKITTINARGAGTGAHQGTEAFSINAAGELRETYWTRESYHGFVRAADGKIKTL